MRTITLISTLIIILLAACAPASEGKSPDTNGEIPVAVTKAIEFLAGELSTEAARIEIVQYEEIEWGDSCLGLPEQDEMCSDAITPGYTVVLSVDGVAYELHTNMDGTSIRQSTEVLNVSE